MSMTKEKYYQKIDDLTYDIWEVALDRSNYDTQKAEFMLDAVIREQVDQHAWVNNTSYHPDILKHSIESGKYLDVLPMAEIYDILQNEGIDGLTSCAVFYAMVEDVKDTFNHADFICASLSLEWPHVN
jgi:hypothetical protein